jgi:phenylalanyl-tRNA synthetase beta chain
MGSLLHILKFNLDRKADRVRLFEVGRVFMRDAAVETTDTTVKGIHQPLKVAGLIYGRADRLQWGHSQGFADFYDVKGDVQSLLAPLNPDFEVGDHPAMHPGRCAKVVLDGNTIGYVGELHPKWRQGYELPAAPLLFELALDAVTARRLPHAKAISKFQAVQRDLAFVVADTVGYADVVRAARAASAAQGLLTDMLLFDVFRMQANEKSLAVRFTLNSDEATLTEVQIEATMQSIVDSVTQGVGARLR